jgi:hypothetical protein
MHKTVHYNTSKLYIYVCFVLSPFPSKQIPNYRLRASLDGYCVLSCSAHASRRVLLLYLSLSQQKEMKESSERALAGCDPANKDYYRLHTLQCLTHVHFFTWGQIPSYCTLPKIVPLCTSFLKCGIVYSWRQRMKYMVVLWFHLTIVYQKKHLGGRENYSSRILIVTTIDFIRYVWLFILFKILYIYIYNLFNY